MYPYNNFLPQFPQNNENQNIKYVSGRASAEVYQMNPNTEDVLFDNSKDTFYFVKTDASGIKSIIECDYTIKKPEDKTSDFVSRTEFDELKSKIDELVKKGAGEDEQST
jgi:hypothetical protein